MSSPVSVSSRSTASHNAQTPRASRAVLASRSSQERKEASGAVPRDRASAAPEAAAIVVGVGARRLAYARPPLDAELGVVELAQDALGVDVVVEIPLEQRAVSAMTRGA